MNRHLNTSEKSTPDTKRVSAFNSMVGETLDWRAGLLIFVTCVILFGLLLGYRSLNIPDEGRYPSIALQMLQTHTWSLPTLNGVPFLDKPILYYWFEALSIHFFGIHAWSIRLPQACFGVMGCMAVWIFGTRFHSQRAGILGACILMVSPLYYFSTRYANMDLEVALWITLTSMMLYTVLRPHHGLKRGQIIHRLCWAGLFSGLGFLTKGLIGPVLPGLVALIYLAVHHRFSTLKSLPLYYPILIFGLVIAPWLWSISQQMPHFLHYFFIYQQVDRFTQGGFNNQMPFYFYIGILLAGLFPWSILSIPSLKSIISCRHFRANKPSHTDQASCAHTFSRADQAFLNYLWVWVIVITVFFSIPHSKIIGYILPVAPALALLIGTSLSKNVHSTWIKIVWCFMAILCISSNVIVESLNLPSSAPLVHLMEPYLTPHTQVISDQRYDEDLPLLLDRPITIAYPWQDPSIMTHDNWARDFYLGAQNLSHPPSHLILPAQIPLLWSADSAHILMIASPSVALQLEQSLHPKPARLGHLGQVILLGLPHSHPTPFQSEKHQ